jgi:hypothetical protein
MGSLDPVEFVRDAGLADHVTRSILGDTAGGLLGL